MIHKNICNCNHYINHFQHVFLSQKLSWYLFPSSYDYIYVQLLFCRLYFSIFFISIQRMNLYPNCCNARILLDFEVLFSYASINMYHIQFMNNIYILLDILEHLNKSNILLILIYCHCLNLHLNLFLYKVYLFTEELNFSKFVWIRLSLIFYRMMVVFYHKDRTNYNLNL